MTRSILVLLLFTLLSVTLSSCSVIGDIFKAGVWVGVLAVAVVVGLFIYLISRAGSKK